MMSKKQRIGTDPFSWIKDSRTEEPAKNPPGAQPNGGAAEQEVAPSEPSTTKQGLKEGWKRHTFIIREHHLEKIQAVAYWERRDIKEVVDEALQLYLQEKEVREVP